MLQGFSIFSSTVFSNIRSEINLELDNWAPALTLLVLVLLWIDVYVYGAFGSVFAEP